jgi:gamma-glutamyltranspeptidase/glutathione hydrolase
VARELVASVQAGGGIWTVDDLRQYRIEERTPQKIRYHDATVTTAPLPSAGGLTLAQALNILRGYPLSLLPAETRAHLVIEALRRAYQDRARYLGDPAFTPVAAAWLASSDYADARAADIAIDRATPSARLGATVAPAVSGGHTTHFSIVDAEGNRVAATMSLNLPFGSGFVAGTTGVLLNDEMDDFAIAPGVANVYGLVGGPPNAIAPGKRPLSSMSPAFVEDERGVLVLGTPGGSRIVSMVLLGILDYLHNPAWTLEGMVAAPRFHHQFLPDRVEIEPTGFTVAWRTALESRGHTLLEARRPWGNMQAVYAPRGGRVQAASDPRGRRVPRAALGARTFAVESGPVPAILRRLARHEDHLSRVRTAHRGIGSEDRRAALRAGRLGRGHLGGDRAAAEEESRTHEGDLREAQRLADLAGGTAPGAALYPRLRAAALH